MPEIIIDEAKCEGKAKCIEVCPENVLELRKPNLRELPFHARLKLKFHGGKQAFAVQPQNCSICLACVEACPEDAISINGAARGLPKTSNSPEKLPKSPFPAWLAFVLTGRLRKFLIDPEKVITQSGIRAGQIVLEVGCGPGFFTEFIAKKVGPEGRVIAQDVQEAMLWKLKNRMAEFPQKENIQPLLSNSSSLRLSPESIDSIFAVHVFEEIVKEGGMAETAKELYRVLKPTGSLFLESTESPPPQSEIS